MLIVLALAGCSWADWILDKQPKPGACEADPTLSGCPDAFNGCRSSAECTDPGAKVCDVPNLTCVQCLAPDQVNACSGPTPVCVGTACQRCTLHAQCVASNVCLPDGSCADPLLVSYVQAGGSGSACTQSMPCGTLDDGVKANKLIVKFAAGLVADNKTTTIDRAVTILADSGAKLSRSNPGVILEIRNDADVKIYDLEVTGGTGSADSAISIPNGGSPKLLLSGIRIDNNQGTGIIASAGSLTIARCTISRNTGGGVSVSGAGTTFDITNSFVFRNGDNSASLLGGLDLRVVAAAANRLAFNTIVDNETSIGAGGVSCAVPAFAAPNNIIARNSLAGSTTATSAQTSGACTYPTSKTQADVTGLGFEHPDVPAPFSYRLTAGSTAIDQATTPVAIDVDNEGEARPQGSQKDIGADEYRNGQ